MSKFKNLTTQMQQLKIKVTLSDTSHVKQENNFILPRNMTTLFKKLFIPKVLIRHLKCFVSIWIS